MQGPILPGEDLTTVRNVPTRTDIKNALTRTDILWSDTDELIDTLYWVANRSDYPEDWNTEIFNLLALVEDLCSQ